MYKKILFSLCILASFSARSQVLNTFAGRYIHDVYAGVTANLCTFEFITGMYFRNGKLFVCERDKNMIRVLDLSSSNVSLGVGNGVPGFYGDGTSAFSAKVDGPQNCAVDASGNIFVSDLYNARIRKVSSSGIITTIAGNGTTGYSGDGGSALSAEIRADGIVADSGNIYMVGLSSGVVRKINSGGIISTFASGVSGLSLSKDASGNLYASHPVGFIVNKIDAAGVVTPFAGTGVLGFSGDGGPAIAAQLSNPWCTVFDRNGNAYIADLDNNRIRKVNTAGIITTIAGTGVFGYSGDGGLAAAAQISNAAALAVDSIGNIYFSNSSNGTGYIIRRIDTAGIVTTISGNTAYGGDGGTAAMAFLSKPTDVCKDAAGNVYIADAGNHTIRKVNGAGTISTLAGTGVEGYSGDGGAATSALLDGPMGIAVNASGDLFYADYYRHVVRKIAAGTGIITTVVGTGTAGFSGDGGPASGAAINAPVGLAVDNSGNLYISDCGNHCIRKVNMSTNIISTYAGTGGSSGFSGDGTAAIGAKLSSPQYIAFDQFNNLLIADKDNNRIRKVDAGAGIISTVFGNGTSGTAGDGGLGISAELCEPTGIAIDDTGGITTTVCGKIRHVPAGGGPVRVDAGAGSNGVSANGLGVDTSVFSYAMNIRYIAPGNLLIADMGNHVVRGTALFPTSVAQAEAKDIVVQLYPNPTNGNFELTGKLPDINSNNDLYCSVRNVLGQEVYRSQLTVTAGQFSSHVALGGQLPTGVYYCIITGAGLHQSVAFQLIR